MKHCLKQTWKALLFLFFLFFTTEIAAQIMVSGTVTDESNESLIGVSVSIKGTATGVITDANGVYSLNAPGNATLVLSYIGMAPVEEAVKNRNTIDIVMREDKNVLDEVVVIGYGTVKKRDLTGAVASIKTDNIDLTSSVSIGHALKGAVAGLSVISNSAQPGGGLEILVRGAGSVNASNKPLYVVDGILIDNALELLQIQGLSQQKFDAGTQSVLNFINPNDIASVEVLKDASATAIYGARAGHGVVMITTKRGSEGKTTVNYDASYGVQKDVNTYDVYNLQEWMGAKNKASWDFWMFNNGIIPYGTRTLEQAIASPVNGVQYRLPYTDSQIDNAGQGTDWVDLISRTGSIQQHNLSVQGGNKQTQFAVAFSYFDQQGIIKNSGIKRYTGRLNLDHAINNLFKVGANLIISRTDNDNIPLGAQPWENSGILRAAVQMGPHIEAIDENGNYPINPELASQPNPYSLLNVTDQSRMDRFIGNAYVSVEPLSGLTIKFNTGADIAYQSRNTYMPKSTLYGGLYRGYATINQSANDKYLVEGTANYLKTFNDIHRINWLAGASSEKVIVSNHSLGNKDFITDAFLWYNIGSGTGANAKEMGSSGEEKQWRSLFTRLNYTLMDRYLLTATFRADACSNFAPNHKWGYFPSVAVAWNIAEESFMESSRSVLSLAKLRVGYGQTGNSDIGPNAYSAYLAYPAYNDIDGRQIIGVFQSRLNNPSLGWETTTEFNLGLDIAFLNGRIFGSFDFYNRIISDLLNDKELNTYQAISRVMANMGKTQGRGFEATINTKNFTGKNFEWSTDFTFSTYRDTWLERTPDWKPTVYQNAKDPLRSIYTRFASHILQTGETPPAAQPLLLPGQIVIKDVDGYKLDEYGNPLVENGRFVRTGEPDGIIDDADMQLLGTTDPGYIAGINNRFRWKNFDFSFSMNGLFDRIMEDPTRMTFGVTAEPISQYGYNGLRILDKIWMPDNPSTEYPSSFFTYSRDGYGDWFYQQAWFIRLQNIQLGYTLPKTPALNKAFSSVRIYVDANNLYVFTPYTGLDPETDVYAAAYPNARTFTAGLSIRF